MLNTRCHYTIACTKCVINSMLGFNRRLLEVSCRLVNSFNSMSTLIYIYPRLVLDYNLK